MAYLKELRNEIDNIDKEMVELFEKRMEIVLNVAKYKIENDLPVLNSSREEEIISKNRVYLKNKELEDYLSGFYINLMNLSKDYQSQFVKKNLVIPNEMRDLEKKFDSYTVNDKNNKFVNHKTKVCFQGTIGSYSEEALFEYFGDENVDTYPVKEFEDVFEELKYENIEYGVLPIENSSTGAITEVYDLLKKYGLYIVGNVSLKISHNLMAKYDTNIEDIKEVYSHPQAFQQCSEFLKEHENFKLMPYYNTAISAELIKNTDNKHMAAIGSKKAAKVNDLNILKENINNNDTNYTRFIIIGKKIETNNENNAISIVFSFQNKVGALYDNLKIFKENNLDMIRIESRPIIGAPWEYFFYIDFQGNINNVEVKGVIDHIKENTSYFKLLGTYKNI